MAAVRPGSPANHDARLSRGGARAARLRARRRGRQLRAARGARRRHGGCAADLALHAGWRRGRARARPGFRRRSGVQAERAEVRDSRARVRGLRDQAPEYDWDDFKGVDVRGKVLVVLNNDPDWDPALFEGTTRLYYGRWIYKYESAARQGAAGVIIIHTTPSAGYPWQVVQSSWSGPQYELPAGAGPRSRAEAWVTEDAARRLLGDAHSLELADRAGEEPRLPPVPLGITTSLALTNTLTRTPTANVFGVLARQRSRARRRVRDLLGALTIISASASRIRPTRATRSSTARATTRPESACSLRSAKRSRPAAAAAPLDHADVRGRRGAGADRLAVFRRASAVPRAEMAANVNFDSGNIWGETRDITFIGFGKSSLDAVALEVAAQQDRTGREISCPIAAITIAPINSTSPRSACPRSI